MFWSIIWQALSGNLAGIVTTITGYFGKLSDNDTAKLQTAIGADKEVAVAQLQANTAAYHDRVDLMKGMKVTQWLIAIALLPPLIHQGSVYLDSTPFFYLDWTGIHSHIVGSWDVPPAPVPYDDREWSMIASLLGIQAAVTTGMGALKLLLKR